MQVVFRPHPHHWQHPNWNRIQLRWFGEPCISRREKNLQDFVITNGITHLHLIKDNHILDDFLQEQNIELVPPEAAEAVIITSQQFSRLDTSVMLDKLQRLLDQCPLIYFCMNKYYLNANESTKDESVPENYDAALVYWLRTHISGATIVNITSTFVEDGSWFTWVVPSSEILICRK